MPRGVYQRKPRAQKDATAKAPKAPKVGKTRRKRRTKEEMAAARAANGPQVKKTRGRKAASIVSGSATKLFVNGEMSVIEQFAVVRDNLVALGQLLTLDSEAVGAELKSNLELMSTLRLRHFGTEEDGEAVTSAPPAPVAATSGDNGTRSTVVPLPPPPQIPPPAPPRPA